LSRDAESRVQDILDAIARCRDYRPYLDGEGSLRAMAYDAVLRNLAVIGEAVRGLPDSAKTQEHVPWASVAGLRNIVVHEYFRVDPAIIVDIVDNHLGALGSALTAPSASSDGEPSSGPRA
jgi:uncharacterized protein with HEPN domain